MKASYVIKHLAGSLLFFVVLFISAGRVDYWQGWAYVAGGQLLYLVAQHQNKFFSSTVRIQEDRGHTVYQKGIYRMVRHPAYLGSGHPVAGISPALRFFVEHPAGRDLVSTSSSHPGEPTNIFELTVLLLFCPDEL